MLIGNHCRTPSFAITIQSLVVSLNRVELFSGTRTLWTLLSTRHILCSRYYKLSRTRVINCIKKKHRRIGLYKLQKIVHRLFDILISIDFQKADSCFAVHHRTRQIVIWLGILSWIYDIQFKVKILMGRF